MTKTTKEVRKSGHDNNEMAGDGLIENMRKCKQD